MEKEGKAWATSRMEHHSPRPWGCQWTSVWSGVQDLGHQAMLDAAPGDGSAGRGHLAWGGDPFPPFILQFLMHFLHDLPLALPPPSSPLLPLPPILSPSHQSPPPCPSIPLLPPSSPLLPAPVPSSLLPAVPSYPLQSPPPSSSPLLFPPPVPSYPLQSPTPSSQ